MQHSGHPRFYELIDTISDLHHRKNSNYARKGEPLSNFQECESFGVPAFQGALVRMSDKWCRIKELSGGTPDAVGESVKDTLMDLAVYSLIAIILYEQSEQSAGDRGSAVRAATAHAASSSAHTTPHQEPEEYAHFI